MLANIYDEQGGAFSQQDLNPILAEHERFTAYHGGKRAILARRRLDGLNLANRILSDADFSGSSLVGATLFGSNLQRTSFYCADLRGSNLQSTNLSRADLRGASFKGANLSHAVLDGGDMRAARMMIVSDGNPTIMDRTTFNNLVTSARVPNGVDFTNCSLRFVSFGNAKLDNADFSGAIMEGVNFKGAKLKNVNFKGAVLTGVNLSDLAVPREALQGCVLDVTAEASARAVVLKAMLIEHENWIASDGKKSGPAVVDNEDLRPLADFAAGRRLIGASMRGVIAVGVSFAGCKLQAAKFDNADLRGADFSDCDLRGASFRGVNLSHAAFSRARIGTINLADGQVLATEFAGATASGHQFLQAVVECPIPELGLL